MKLKRIREGLGALKRWRVLELVKESRSMPGVKESLENQRRCEDSRAIGSRENSLMVVERPNKMWRAQGNVVKYGEGLIIH